MFGRGQPQDYEQARAWMVERQLLPRGITDAAVIRAMRETPRHHFVPQGRQDRAYEDRPLPIGQGQTISQPYIVAYMTQALGLQGQEKVLEIGTGSGYQTAILSRLARVVISVERIDELSQSAQARLAALGYDNIVCVVGDGSLGYAEQAPYDAILLTAASPEVPLPLCEQLTDGGCLLGPIGARYDQALVRLRRQGERWEREMLIPVIFVPLVGSYGWRE